MALRVGLNNFTKIHPLIRGFSDCPHPLVCKVAVITGGATGMGAEFAKALLASGGRGVVLGDIRCEEGEQLVRTLNDDYGCNKAIFRKTDVTKLPDLENLFIAGKDKYKQLDILINNAGLMQDKNWRKEIDVNVIGTISGTLLGFEYMGTDKKGVGGVIINISSALGLMPLPGCPIYTGSKHFIVGFSRSMGHKFYQTRTGVKVLTLCPGVTGTEMIQVSHQYSLEGFGDTATLLRRGLDAVPAQHVSACGHCLLDILRDGENGSVWVVENGDCFKVKFPYVSEMRHCKS